MGGGGVRGLRYHVDVGFTMEGSVFLGEAFLARGWRVDARWGDFCGGASSWRMSGRSNLWMFAESRRESLVGFPQSRRTVTL